MPPSGHLFDPEVPPGFRYSRELLSAEDEERLARAIEGVAFSTFEMRGVIARRRVAFFGSSYDRAAAPPPPMPEFLLGLREQVAAWSQIPAASYVMALINEYPPGAPIGWHRDAPQYDIVAGISLLSDCRMKFRPYVRPVSRPAASAARRLATHEIRLARRSVYLLTGEARNAYEHHIPAVPARRYSITFRTER